MRASCPPDRAPSTHVQVRVSYYRTDQIDLLTDLDPSLYAPWDVRFNLGSKFLERDLFERLLDTWDPRFVYQGVFSWKFLAKSGIDQEHINRSILDGVAQGVDAIILNPAFGCNAIFKNGFEQGQICGHVSMNAIAREIGLGDLASDILPHDTFVMSSYVIGTRRFWEDYLRFLGNFIRAMEHLAQVRPTFSHMYYGSAGYHRNGFLDYRPFVIERLLQIFLLRFQPKIKYIEPNEESFRKKQPQHFDIIKTLYGLKSLAVRDFAAREAWLNGRKSILGDHKALLQVLVGDDPSVPAKALEV